MTTKSLLVSVTALVLIAAIAASASAQSRNRHRKTGTPGVFDYYVLSLSWSPQFCAGPAGERDAAQCGGGRQFAFVVHGLWPQYEKGFPEACAASTTVSDAIVQRMLPLMPSARLIQHEWDQHGTCSGQEVAAYFDTIQYVRDSVKIPPEYTAPVQQINVSPGEIKKKFVAANAGYAPDSVHVLCSGRFLSEVRVCFTKDFHSRECSASVRDTCSVDPVIMRPVR